MQNDHIPTSWIVPIADYWRTQGDQMGKRARENCNQDHSSKAVDEIRKQMRRERNKEAAAR